MPGRGAMPQDAALGRRETLWGFLSLGSGETKEEEKGEETASTGHLAAEASLADAKICEASSARKERL